MSATIKDIAREAQVSVSTVSYALNDGPRNVPPEVKARVLAIAKTLRYRPNRIARSLVTKQTHTIGVVPMGRIIDLARIAYFAAVFNGIVNQAEEQEYDVTILTRSRGETDAVLDGRSDGLIFLAPHADAPALLAAQEYEVPFVTVSAQCGTAPAFTCANEMGIEAAVEHLTGLGHRRIAHLSGRLSLSDGRERHDAYLGAMAIRGLTPHVVDGDFTPEGGEAAFRLLMSGAEPPSGVVCGNDDEAMGALNAAIAMGIRIPEDCSIVGFDDAAYAGYLQPPLTTIAQPFDAMGAAAVDALIRLISGDSPESRLFTPQLVMRASTTRPKLDSILCNEKHSL